MSESLKSNVALEQKKLPNTKQQNSQGNLEAVIIMTNDCVTMGVHQAPVEFVQC